MQATFSKVSDQSPREVAECIASSLGENAKLGFLDDAYLISVPRGIGVLRFRVVERIDAVGSVVEYDSELGRGAELDLVNTCV
ncbi:hypothetical protein [Altererythrobacter lutimaris]|uniref:hypothetical protein n=1 Tax=Altererythrobacter lutimaris TaxID=2743979 RepID=UPI001593D1CB|nr:hypothetical protein [Altererythrobacter lutimaris]